MNMITSIEDLPEVWRPCNLREHFRENLARALEQACVALFNKLQDSLLCVSVAVSQGPPADHVTGAVAVIVDRHYDSLSSAAVSDLCALMSPIESAQTQKPELEVWPLSRYFSSNLSKIDKCVFDRAFYRSSRTVEAQSPTEGTFEHLSEDAIAEISRKFGGNLRLSELPASTPEEERARIRDFILALLGKFGQYIGSIYWRQTSDRATAATSYLCFVLINDSDVKSTPRWELSAKLTQIIKRIAAVFEVPADIHTYLLTEFHSHARFKNPVVVDLVRNSPCIYDSAGITAIVQALSKGLTPLSSPLATLDRDQLGLVYRLISMKLLEVTHFSLGGVYDYGVERLVDRPHISGRQVLANALSNTRQFIQQNWLRACYGLLFVIGLFFILFSSPSPLFKGIANWSVGAGSAAIILGFFTGPREHRRFYSEAAGALLFLFFLFSLAHIFVWRIPVAETIVPYVFTLVALGLMVVYFHGQTQKPVIFGTEITLDDRFSLLKFLVEAGSGVTWAYLLFHALIFFTKFHSMAFDRKVLFLGNVVCGLFMMWWARILVTPYQERLAIESRLVAVLLYLAIHAYSFAIGDSVSNIVGRQWLVTLVVLFLLGATSLRSGALTVRRCSVLVYATLVMNVVYQVREHIFSESTLGALVKVGPAVLFGQNNMFAFFALIVSIIALWKKRREDRG